MGLVRLLRPVILDPARAVRCAPPETGLRAATETRTQHNVRARRHTERAQQVRIRNGVVGVVQEEKGGVDWQEFSRGYKTSRGRERCHYADGLPRILFITQPSAPRELYKLLRNQRSTEARLLFRQGPNLGIHLRGILIIHKMHISTDREAQHEIEFFENIYLHLYNLYKLCSIYFHNIIKTLVSYILSLLHKLKIVA